MGSALPAGAAGPPGAGEGRALLALFDWKLDAFGGPPFVPQAAAAEFLLALGLRTGTPFALKAALRSLSVLAKSELADPIEGGFFDACAQPGWKAPHTRKSLAVNASLLQAMATAGAWAEAEALMRAARSTAEFIDKAMGAEGSDLWVSALRPDDEYYGKMGHRRGQAQRPAEEGAASPGDNARAICALVRAGVCLDEPRFLARARIAGRELFDGEIPKGLSDRAAMAVAAADLTVASGEWTEVVPFGELWRRGVQAAELVGGLEAARPRAELVCAHLRFGSVEADDGREADAREAAALSAQGGTIEDMAVVGMAKLLAGAQGLDLVYGGPRPAAAEGTAVRAALAAAWAIGAPHVAPLEPSGAQPQSVGIRFVTPGKASPQTSDPREVKRMLRSVVDLKEAL